MQQQPPQEGASNAETGANPQPSAPLQNPARVPKQGRPTEQAKRKKTLLEQREEEHKKKLQKEAKKESKKKAKKESTKEDNVESSSKPKPRRKVTCSFCSEEEHTIKTRESFLEYKAMMWLLILQQNVSFAPRKATQCNHAFTLKLRWQKSRDMLNRVIM